MSFSSEVKEELIRLTEHELHFAVAELSAIIHYGGKVSCSRESGYSIVLHTENISVAKRFYSLLKQIFPFQPEVITTRHQGSKKNHMYSISIDKQADVLLVLKTTGLVNNLGQMDEEDYLIDNPILQRTCCRRAFLRGAFLVSGSITDPERNYHFEITGQDWDRAEQLRDLMNYFGLEAKIVVRKKYYVVYLKEGSMISDALNIMEAHVAMMQFENVRIIKDVRNSVNRRVNCEAANINKTVSAARKQIEDIEYIRSTVGLHQLPESLQEVAAVRLEEPDATLKELGEMLHPAVGKSGVNHRLRKISQIAQNIREHGNT
ncbi:MAG: DNA-binding protein WhiA [Clostridiales bacterium]|nr:DNA-binding protein WhiA [Clostridiales bacterium]